MYYLKTDTGAFEAYGTYTKIIEEGFIKLLVQTNAGDTYIMLLYQT